MTPLPCYNCVSSGKPSGIVAGPGEYTIETCGVCKGTREYTPQERYFLSRDNDGHWYVVPVSKMKEWYLWCDFGPEDADSWQVPVWAEEIGGSPCLVTFSEYRIE